MQVMNTGLHKQVNNKVLLFTKSVTFRAGLLEAEQLCSVLKVQVL